MMSETIGIDELQPDRPARLRLLRAIRHAERMRNLRLVWRRGRRAYISAELLRQLEVLREFSEIDTQSDHE